MQPALVARPDLCLLDAPILGAALLRVIRCHRIARTIVARREIIVTPFALLARRTALSLSILGRPRVGSGDGHDRRERTRFPAQTTTATRCCPAAPAPAS